MQIVWGSDLSYPDGSHDLTCPAPQGGVYAVTEHERLRILL